MVKYIMRLKEFIYKSLQKNGEPSSGRLFAFNMQMIIFLAGIAAIGIEVTNAVVQWKQGKTHTIPWEHITIFGMWLAHQLTLLGIYKKNETTISKVGESVKIKLDTKD